MNSKQQQQQQQQQLNRTNSQIVSAGHTLQRRATTKHGPEIEISKRPQNAGGKQHFGAAGSRNVSTDEDNGESAPAAVVEQNIGSTSTSRDSVETSVTWYNGDDVTPALVLGGRSAETSGVFSRMSTEARQAWIAVKQSGTVGNTSDDEARATCGVGDFISGSGVRQTNTRQRRVKKTTTQETAYNVFEPRANEAPVTSAATYRVQTAPRNGRHDSRAAAGFGSFRITSAAYDSRFVDMAAAAAASRGVQNDSAAAAAADVDQRYDDDDDEDAEIRAASVAKCLSWLKTQTYYSHRPNIKYLH